MTPEAQEKGNVTLTAKGILKQHKERHRARVRHEKELINFLERAITRGYSI